MKGNRVRWFRDVMKRDNFETAKLMMQIKADE